MRLSTCLGDGSVSLSCTVARQRFKWLPIDWQFATNLEWNYRRMFVWCGLGQKAGRLAVEESHILEFFDNLSRICLNA